MEYSAVTPRGIVNIIYALESSEDKKLPNLYVVENNNARSLILSLLNERMILVPEVLTVQDFLKLKLYERTGKENSRDREKLIDYCIFEMYDAGDVNKEIKLATLRYLAINALPLMNEQNLDELAQKNAYGQYLKDIRTYLTTHEYIEPILSFGYGVENAPYQVALVSLTGECSSTFKAVFNEVKAVSGHSAILISLKEEDSAIAEEKADCLSYALATNGFANNSNGDTSLLATMGPEADRKGIVLQVASLIHGGCKDVYVANIRPQDLELVQRELYAEGISCDLFITEKLMFTNLGLVFNSFFGENVEMNEKLFLSLVSNEAMNIDYTKRSQLQDWITRQYKPNPLILANELSTNSNLYSAILSLENSPNVSALDLVVSLLDEYIQSLMKKTRSLAILLDLSAAKRIKQLLIDLITDYEIEQEHVLGERISPMTAVWRRNSCKNVSAISGNRAQVTLSSDVLYPGRRFDGVVIANMISAELKVATEHVPENDFLALCNLNSNVAPIDVSKRKFRNLVFTAKNRLVIHRPFVSRKGEEEPVSAFYQMVVDAYDENSNGEKLLFDASGLSSIRLGKNNVHLSDGSLKDTRFILGKMGVNNELSE